MRRLRWFPQSIRCGGLFTTNGYQEVILPAIWEQTPFVAKAGPEILEQMYAFPDKKGRPICLIPEATAVIQQMWREEWAKSTCGPLKLFYAARCYRYERPQKGRYREFLQFGVELLNGKEDDADEVKSLLKELVSKVAPGVDCLFNDSVKRGLTYYIEDGFEAECPILGAQKQVAGGGRYDCGIGFAIGVDRLLLAKQLSSQKD
jgi:histidyl-tRNA synthetase